MPLYKFKNNDIFYNTLKMNPEYTFVIYDGKTYLNNRSVISGKNVTNVGAVSGGYVNLYELNIDRDASAAGGPPYYAGNLIHPWLYKGSTRTGFKTIGTEEYNKQEYGHKLTGSYPMSASITREFFDALGAGIIRSRTASANHFTSLMNTLEFYTPLSPHYAVSGTAPIFGDKSTQAINLISIPSIVFGSQIKKGSVNMKFYVSGTLIGELQDERRNGELVQIGPTGSANSGSIAGVMLYNEGFAILTGNWDIASGKYDGFAGEQYKKPYDDTSLYKPRWLYFGVGAEGGGAGGGGGFNPLPPSIITASSYELSFKGTTKNQTIMMLAHAEKGKLNHSNNPTYKTFGQNLKPITGSKGYFEKPNISIKNIVSSSYANTTGSFQKITYISSIGIYDQKRNLIGIAKLATPVKKTENREFTFKLKLDI